MNEETKQRISEWLRHSPLTRGVLVRGIRFPDQTFVCDLEARDFPSSALEQAWRSVADTFQVLTAQRLPADRLTWVYEHAILHYVRRGDGAMLGLFVSKKHGQADPGEIERLLNEFLLLDSPPG